MMLLSSSLLLNFWLILVTGDSNCVLQSYEMAHEISSPSFCCSHQKISTKMFDKELVKTLKCKGTPSTMIPNIYAKCIGCLGYISFRHLRLNQKLQRVLVTTHHILSHNITAALPTVSKKEELSKHYKIISIRYSFQEALQGPFFF